jgi:hypothetical protein
MLAADLKGSGPAGESSSTAEALPHRPSTQGDPVKQIHKRLTYANVMSSIAVFLILGGATAFAATKIGSNEIKSNAITTGKIKKEAVSTAKIKKNSISTVKIQKDAVTGDKVNESTLGEVPGAAKATTATTAANAEKVGGSSLVRFAFNQTAPAGPTQILNLNGLQLIANCPAGAVTLTAQTTVNDSEVSAENTNATTNPATFSFGAFDDSFNVGDNFTANGADHTDIIGRVEYTSSSFAEVQVYFHEEDSIGTSNCILNGYAIGS